MYCFFVLISFLGLSYGYNEHFNIGIILRNDDEVSEKIIDNVLWKILSNGPQPINYLAIKEKVPDDDPFNYHEAVCRLLKKGVGALLSPTAASSFPILVGYSNEYNLSLVSPSLLETPQDPKAEDLMPRMAVGIQPSTTRAMLDLIRDFRWQEIIYIYDHDYGPEKLQEMFRVGYKALRLKLVGFVRVSTAQEANEYLRSVAAPGKTYRIILDTHLDLTRSFLQLHLHHTGIRKRYNFLVTQPALETFWMQHEFGALRITGFIALPPNWNRMGNIKGEWMKLIGHQTLETEPRLSPAHYYYHDAAQFLAQAVRGMRHRNFNYRPRIIKPLQIPDSSPDCVQEPIDDRMAPILKKIKVEDGLTGKIEFSEVREKRINVNLTIVQSTSSGYNNIGSWSDAGLARGMRKHIHLEGSHIYLDTELDALAQVSNKNSILRITTILSPPYMMLLENGSFVGYCKDMIDLICEMLDKQCELGVVADGTRGDFDTQKGRWSGMIGELLDGVADIAVADLTITADRQRIVEFTEPFDMVSLSVLMKNPKTVSSSMFFVFNAFTADVWICIVVAAILFSLIFHGITKFTGAPDSIESVAGIWGRKNAITMNGWFAIGSSMMQGTGVYPRSISSRLLTIAWWFTTGLFICMYIASLNAQLQIQETEEENDPRLGQLSVLSLESIILESLERGWPKIGLLYPSNTALFIMKSNLPLYSRLQQHFDDHPDLKISDINEGIRRVRESDGGFIFLMGSIHSDYAIRQAPCDLIATHDSIGFAGHGVAISPQLDEFLASNISECVTQLHNDGVLSVLHRKWWIEASQCKEGFVPEVTHGSLFQISGAICVFLGFIGVVLIVIAIQFTRKLQDKESRRQQLTFEDMNLDNRLPTPPPEMLTQPPPVLNVPEIEVRTENATIGSESFKDFFDRMRGGP